MYFMVENISPNAFTLALAPPAEQKPPNPQSLKINI